jgi:CRP-like cAMP-binding protein
VHLIRQSPDLALAVIEELTNRLRETNEQASSLSFQGVKERTRGFFERVAQVDVTYGGRRLTPPLTHQQIADMIGTSRETVTRAVKQLKQDGWLDQAGKRYVIPHPTQL